MTIIRVNVVADTVSRERARITTLDCVYPRFPVHEQLLMHRVFSRNAMSYRAVRIEKLIAEVVERPSIPIDVRYDERGMQGYTHLGGNDLQWFLQKWTEARDEMVRIAREMTQHRIHKQTVNRLLQPFAHIESIVTSTEWGNFFQLRLEHDAQPEMQALAKAMQEAIENSVPTESQHHIPFVTTTEERDDQNAWLLSAARCARVSYLSHGNRSGNEVEFARRLWDNGHLSPFEHTAMATPDADERFANFKGWASLRYMNGR